MEKKILFVISAALMANPAFAGLKKVKLTVSKKEIKSSEQLNLSFSLLSPTSRRISPQQSQSAQIEIKSYSSSANCNSDSSGNSLSPLVNFSQSQNSQLVLSAGSYFLKALSPGYQSSECIGVTVLDDSVQFGSLTLEKGAALNNKLPLSIKWKDSSGSTISSSATQSASVSFYTDSSCSVRKGKTRTLSVKPKNGTASISISSPSDSIYVKASVGSISSECLGLYSPKLSITAGDEQTCALTLSGGVKCWGSYGFGGIGNGYHYPDPSSSDIINEATGDIIPYYETSVPVDVLISSTNQSPLSGVKQVESIGATVCALMDDSGVKCWGSNESGMLGAGLPTGIADSPYPVDVVSAGFGTPRLLGVKKIFHNGYGADHVCALMQDNTAKCWGNNSSGQLGDGHSYSNPYEVLTDESGNEIGRIVESPHPRSVLSNGVGSLPLSGLTKLSIGADWTCALTSSGGVKCWGDNASGELGDGHSQFISGQYEPNAYNNGIEITQSAIPVDVLSSGVGSPPLSGIISIESGTSHTCAVTNAGGVKCWGWNLNGQLGDGHHSPDNPYSGLNSNGDQITWNFSPVPVTAIESGAKEISLGWDNTCALMNSGEVKCWGQNNLGQLGTGNTENSSIPVTTSLSEIESISLGDMHSCAVTTTGSLKCWGDNSSGYLGNGTTTNSLVPVEVDMSGFQ